MNNTNNTASNNRVDLTLKLGMPSTAFHQNAALYHNSQQGGVDQGATAEGGQQSFNGIGSQTPYAWPSDQMGSGFHNMNYANGFNPFSAGPSLGFGSYPTTNPSSYNFAPTRPLPPRPPPPPLTGYTLLDVPLKRSAALELQNSSGYVSNYNDPNRRCTNYNCKTNDTPMWRKGPLGPKEKKTSESMENSRLFNQAAGEMNNTNNTESKNRVDLTLKLGIPSTTFHQNATLYHNTQQGGVNQGATVEGGQQSFNGIGSQTPSAWPSDQMGSSLHNMNYANGFNPFSAGPSLGFGSYATTNPSSYNFAPTHPLPPPPPPPTGYTLLAVPLRRAAALELENSSGRVGNYNDPNRRCTNYNCRTNDTPMWRKGPLGPKTLCNACGIKYRKEEEKKAKEAGGKGRRSNPNS
ncbi:hypothetical protein V6N12_072303 [Hibiscus sabdariffa]|uniref:GATA-type domain-containing protein n=1 Tax=Hibiscus sabdariffa TaxID=183260 RepID=A0ABR2FMB6_9ROSI